MYTRIGDAIINPSINLVVNFFFQIGFVVSRPISDQLWKASPSGHWANKFHCSVSVANFDKSLGVPAA